MVATVLPNVQSKLRSWYSKTSNRIFLGGVVLFTITLRVGLSRLDPDFGWHIASGRYILAHFLPRTDIFTYTAHSFAWINHEWLNDVVMAHLYSLGGYRLLGVAFALMWSGALLIASRRYNLLALILSACLLLPYTGVRALTWTVLGIAVLERLLERDKPDYKLAIPLLFVVWANVHGGFIFGLTLLLGYQIFARTKPGWGIVVASVLASFVNPYGPMLYVELARTGFDVSLGRYISEWQPLFYVFSTSLYLVVYLSTGIVTKMRDLAKRHYWPSWIALGMMIRANRNTTLFAVASLRHLEEFLHELARLWPKKQPRLTRIITSLMIVGLVGSFGYLGFTRLIKAPSRTANYPTGLVARIRDEHLCHGNIFNDYNVGGYMIGEGVIPVYIDGRMPSWRDEYGHKYMDNYFDFYRDSTSRAEQIHRYNIECVLVGFNPKVGRNQKLIIDHNALIDSLKRGGWSEIGVERGYVLLRSN